MFFFVIRNPGTGKTFVSGLVLAYTVCNRLVSYTTSLASRRADSLNGEHIHKLLKIAVNTLDPLSQADQALVKLNNDNERRTLLSQLQVFFVEETSLINAETWVAMDHILRKLKNNESSFGRLAMIANGDCCQLPNITGQNIFYFVFFFN